MRHDPSESRHADCYPALGVALLCDTLGGRLQSDRLSSAVLLDSWCRKADTQTANQATAESWSQVLGGRWRT